MPHGARDLIGSIYLIARGVFANAFILAPVLLCIAAVTLLSHPSVASLDRPSGLSVWLWDHFAFWPFNDPGSHFQRFWHTALLVNILFLFFWAVIRTLQERTNNFWMEDRQKIYDNFKRISRGVFYLFFFTAVAIAFDIHVFVLGWQARPSGVAATPTHFDVNTLLALLSRSDVQSVLALFGAVIAYSSNRLGQAAARAAQSTLWSDWFKKIAATTALRFVALIIPFFLWRVCLWLSLIGLTSGSGSDPASYLLPTG
jgi:hypothetical protein